MASQLEQRLVPTVAADHPHPLTRTIELLPLPTADEGGPVGDSGADRAVPRAFWRRHGLFLSLFVLPVGIAALYFGLVAADVYVAQAKFIVRSSSSTGGGALALLTQTQGFGRAVDETYAVAEFMQSPDAARELEARHNLRAVLSRREADVIARYPRPFSNDNAYRLYRAYRAMMDVDVDQTTGISSLEVRAFLPEDASTIAAALIEMAERFVNEMNERANRDSEIFADRLVREAQLRLANVETRLADYRRRELIIDPGQETSASLANLGKLATEISKLEASLAQQVAMAPGSPTIGPLRERIRSFQDELAKQQAQIVGGADSMANKIQGYEILVLERDLASKGLAAAQLQWEKARQEAQSQRIYLQTVVDPRPPDTPLLPHRGLWILCVAIVAFAIHLIAKSFLKATMEHRP